MRRAAHIARKDTSASGSRTGSRPFFTPASRLRTGGGQSPAIQAQQAPPASATPADWQTLDAAGQRSFLRRHRARFTVLNQPQHRLAGRILADMASTTTNLRFDSEDELVREVRKRLVTAVMMRHSQGARVGGRWMSAFGYPYRGGAASCGPRVNVAARAYWGPMQGRARGVYSFELSAQGRRNGYQALQTLFTRQRRACNKTLIHCDYLVSVLHFLSFAESLGATEFNRRVQSGQLRMRLNWNGFDEITQRGSSIGRNTSLQNYRPSSPSDLIIGDHVTFFNHPMYDVLIDGVGGVWRLENAILVDRRNGQDLFQGHGYRNPVPESRMKRSMLRHIENHVGQVRRDIRRLRSGSSRRRRTAQENLRRRTGVRLVNGEYKVVGTAFDNMRVQVNEPLRVPDVSELPGLRDPRDLSRMYPVVRPIESQ